MVLTLLGLGSCPVRKVRIVDSRQRPGITAGNLLLPPSVQHASDYQSQNRHVRQQTEASHRPPAKAEVHCSVRFQCGVSARCGVSSTTMDNDNPGPHGDLDDDLLDQIEEDFMRLADLLDAEADRVDADVLAELDRHVQDLDDLLNPAPAIDGPLAQVINIADRRVGRWG